jgi:hypothetical protein
VCWLSSALDKRRLVAVCMERGWIIEAERRAA